MMTALANNSQLTSQPKSSSDLVVIRDFYCLEKVYYFQINSKTDTYSLMPHSGSDHIHGFGVQSEAGGSGGVTAYFSRDRVEDKSAPRYELSMYFAINGEIFCLNDGSSKFIWKVGFFNRSFRIRRSLKDDFVYSYRWPFYRQLFARVFGDPFNYVSRDFFEDFFKTARFYYPHSFAAK
jgi:hypothetical protein